MLEIPGFLRAFKTLLFDILILQQGLPSRAQNEKQSQYHEVTIFVIPSLSPIDWSNPSNLYSSTSKCFLKAATTKTQYIIGHTIARVSSPNLKKPVFAAMSGSRAREKAEMVLTRGLGLGSLGTTIGGHIEPVDHIHEGIETHKKQKRIAYIKFRINEQALQRILKFIDGFQRKINKDVAPCNLYNGATWPRYENEGAGCSAFGMSILDVAHLLPNESRNWRVDVKIPMHLIGGVFNHNKKVSLKTILKTKSWYKGKGTPDVDFVHHKLYDPSIIYNWILNMRTQNHPEYLPDMENNIPGLLVDRQGVYVDDTEPIFLQRKEADLFVRNYHNEIKNLFRKEA